MERQQHFYPVGDGLVVSFDIRAVKNDTKSRAQGRLVCDEVVYLTKVNPADRNSRIHRPLREEDKTQFSRQYEHWLKGQEAVREGTPLEQWCGCTRSQVEELRHLHIRTVEQVAALTEKQAENMGPEYAELRNRASDFLKMTAGGAPLEELRAKLAEKERELDALKEQHKQALGELQSLRKLEPERKAEEPGRTRSRQQGA